MHTFTATSPYAVDTVIISLSSLVRSMTHLLMPMVVVSRKMTSSRASRSDSLQMTVRSHAGRFFFMYTGE